jgi:hypothetical protein
MPRAFHPQQDLAAQNGFKKNGFSRAVRRARQAAERRSRRLRIMFADGHDAPTGGRHDRQYSYQIERALVRPRSFWRFRCQPRWSSRHRRIYRGKPVLVKICGELAIDVRPDQSLKCIGNLSVLVAAIVSPFFRKISIRNEFLEQIIVRAVG